MQKRKPSPNQIVNKKEYAFWKRKIKLLSPEKGDVLVVPAEAHFDFKILSEALKQTKCIMALVVPEGNASLLEKDEAVRLAKDLLNKYEK